MIVDKNVEIGGNSINFNTGYLAKQADGSVLVSCGETIIFASAVVSKTAKEGQDFFPLTVDYREKTYAGGKIPGGFIKREPRPSDREILTSRLIDRPLRPLFPKDFVNELQIIIYVLSADKTNQQDIIAINAAAAALSIAGTPFKGPVGAVRIGRVDGNWLINPTFEEIENSDIDLVVAGTKKAVTMIEGSSKNVSEEDMIQAVDLAHKNIIEICNVMEDFSSTVNKTTMEYTPYKPDDELFTAIRDKYYGEIETLKDFKIKHDRDNTKTEIIKKAEAELEEQFPDTIDQASTVIDKLDGEIVRKNILDHGSRADGRSLTEIRPIDVMVGLLPRAHGSAVFTRGETQSIGITTLGSTSNSQRMDNLEGEFEKSFMLHYHFPPFSVGEVGRHGGTGRREIGHGMLAERALEYIIPSKEEFPYAIRQVSEITESNGSSSMASVCSGSLSLFNAGVPVKASVAGIAMGLVMEGDQYAVLSDIIGLEDHLGDMDFKVAGTKDGITAFQLDIKIEGITTEIMRVALEQAREGRLHILDKMDAVISNPEDGLSKYAPKIVTMSVNPEKIGEIIGPGGKMIRKIIEETGADISIEDDGSVFLTSNDDESIEKAKKYIKGITDEVEINKWYDGVVKRIEDYGAFIEVLPGKEGLLHISKMDNKRVNKVTDVVSLGDTISVKVIKIDEKGRIDLSRKDSR